MATKPLVQSKTVIGAITMMAAYFSALLAGQQPEYGPVEIITSAGIVVGFVLTIYGRFTAKEPIDGIFKSVVADLQVTQIVPDENSHDN